MPDAQPTDPKPSYLSRFLHGRRRMLMALLLVSVVAALGFVGRKRIQRWYVSSANSPRPLQLANVDTWEKYRDCVADRIASPLDVPPEKWSPAVVTEPFRSPESWNFTLEDIASPMGFDKEQAVRAFPIVRPAPYPHFRLASIASDCCATTFPDVFYTHTLLSRKHGIDATSSFMPFCADRQPWLFLFHGESGEPQVQPVPLEGDRWDAVPLLLTYFYRGWVDHIHSWSFAPSHSYSFLTDRTLTVSPGGKAEERLDVVKTLAPSTWECLELDIQAGEGIESWEIVLTDRGDREHVITCGTPLKQRSGWEVNPVKNGKKTYLALAEERNRPQDSGLGKVRANEFVVKDAILKAAGRPGASLRFNGLIFIDVSRTAILEHAKWMKSHNLLPALSTWHGGGNSWASSVPYTSKPYPLPTESKAGKKTTVHFSNDAAWGTTLDSPTYHRDVLTDLGCWYQAQTQLEGSRDLQIRNFPDGHPHYFLPTLSPRIVPPLKHLAITPNTDQFENLGYCIANGLSQPSEFGSPIAIYLHFNRYSQDAFEPAVGEPMQMHLVKRLHPNSEAALRLLSDCKYDLNGTLKFHQRTAVYPIGAQARFLQMQRKLAAFAKREDNKIVIMPWKDEVTGQTTPSREFVSQDLQGQTFYVPHSQSAKLFVGDSEIRSLVRNPSDFTGRESITVADTTRPIIVFDEVDLHEMNGRVMQENASYRYRSGKGYHGNHSFEVVVDKDGTGHIDWEPFALDMYETDYFRFAFKKSNAKSIASIELIASDGTRFVATEGELGGLQGWSIHRHASSDYQEVVLDFAQMTMPSSGRKVVPRKQLRAVRFKLADAKAGDAAMFDQVEFLSVRGTRPHAGDGFVIGGRLVPGSDGEKVRLRIGNKVRSEVTQRGGWFMFAGVPPGAVIELSHERDGVEFYPVQGRVVQSSANSLEYHIHTSDPRCPSVPRPMELIGQSVPARMAASDTEHATFATPQPNPAQNAIHRRIGEAGSKWSRFAETKSNLLGFLERDRFFDNPDGAVRIIIQGSYQIEGGDCMTSQRTSAVLESMLRRRTGVPIETFALPAAGGSPAEHAASYDSVGKKFGADLTVLLLAPSNLIALESSLLEKAEEWKDEQGAIWTADFGREGSLRLIPPHKENVHAARRLLAKKHPVADGVPLESAFFATGPQPPSVEKAIRLLKAILREKYLSDARQPRKTVAIAFGYDDPITNFSGKVGGATLDRAVWYAAMRDVCRECCVHSIDLSAFRRNRNAAFDPSSWEFDRAFSPAGHHRLASALAESILDWPEFKQIAKAPKK